jgi:hypothetical protein
MGKKGSGQDGPASRGAATAILPGTPPFAPAAKGGARGLPMGSLAVFIPVTRPRAQAFLVCPR